MLESGMTTENSVRETETDGILYDGTGNLPTGKKKQPKLEDTEPSGGWVSDYIRRTSKECAAKRGA
jgi:hypothetical protein